jgi:2-methylcitrate dehydratase PrpD
MDETAHLADHVAATTLEDAPDDAVARAKTAIRDVVGLALHGSGHETGALVADHLAALGGDGTATAVGHGVTDPVRAAFATGAFAHVLNYDDTFESVVIHPSTTAFPAALAAAETAGGTGRGLLAGYLVGLDASHRVGRAVAPTHWLRGWHATATVGTLGATAAAASVFGLDADATRRAFGVAASFASGLKRNIGTQTNPIHCGHAAGNGVEAALLARNGAGADPSILRGTYGFGTLATGGEGYDPAAVTDPDVAWAVRDLAFKPYPSGVVTHAAMEALRAIVDREDLAPDDVARITATVDEGVMDTIDQNDPQTATEATVSYEFCLAAVLRERDPGLAAFTDGYVRAPETRAQMAKVGLDPRPDPFGEHIAEASYGARVAVETTDGRQFAETVLETPGGPSNPLSEARLRAKFDECAGTVLDPAAADRVADAIDRLDTAGGLGGFLRAVRA